jgi:hypothetical protein
MQRKLTLICVQPCIPYYAWQIEVMLKNLQELEIHKNYSVQLLFAYNKNENGWEENVEWIKKVERAYSDVAEFFYYEDTRIYPITYISGIRPNLLKQHLKLHPEVGESPIFYHDCDIVFTKYPDFLQNLLADNNWYVSDTISYIGYDYILSKGQDVLNKMCEIVGVQPEFIKERQLQSGGAQYLMKGVDWMFFEKMEKDCERMFKEITQLNNIKKQENPSYHELQIWTSDMWCILWNAWLRGYDTKVIPEMDFCWATDTIEKWNEKYIFHNAGVTHEIRETVFYKADFRSKLPYLENGIKYNQEKASINYFRKIRDIGADSCLYQSKSSAIVEKYGAGRTQEQLEIAQNRVDTCLICENFTKNTNNDYLCKKCGCSTKAKIFSPNANECPEQKWKI